MGFFDQILSRHFNAATLRKLAKRGVRVIGFQLVPTNDGWADSWTAYQVDDNGTGRVLSHSDLLAIAE